LGFPLPYFASELNFIQNSPFEWQVEIIKMLDQKPDGRTIHWVFDPLGSTGIRLLNTIVFVRNSMKLG